MQTLDYGYHSMQQQVPQGVSGPRYEYNPLRQQHLQASLRNHPSTAGDSVLGQNRPGPTVQHFKLDDLATAY